MFERSLVLSKLKFFTYFLIIMYKQKTILHKHFNLQLTLYLEVHISTTISTTMTNLTEITTHTKK